MVKTGLVIVTLTALLVSLSSIFSQFAYDAGANPQTMIFFRFLLFCTLFLLIRPKSDSPVSFDKSKRVFAVLAGCFFTLGSGSLLASIYFLPVSLAVVIFYTYPILTMVGEKFIDRQSPDPMEVGCFLLAFIGLILALNIQIDKAISPIGIAFGITAALGMSTSYLISDRKLKGIPPQQSTFYLATTGLVLISLFIVATQSFSPGETNFLNLLFIFLASISFACAFFLMFKGINLIGAVNTAMILNLEPIFTIALAFLILKESLSNVQLSGAACVLLAIVIIQRVQTR